MDKLPANLPSVEWVLLTPERADELLLRNTNNRKATKLRVEHIAGDMRAGQYHWQAGAKVMVGTDGQLLDGQKTCMAVVASGVSIPVVFFEGVDPEAWAFIDNAQPRLFSQELVREGIANASVVAGAAKVLWQEANGLPVGGRDGPSIATLREVWQETPALAERAVDGKRISVGCRFGSPSVMAGLMVRADQLDPEGAAAFFGRLEAGNREKGNPNPVAQTLRYLDRVNAPGTRRGPDSQQGAARLIKAFNASRLGDTRTIGPWKPDREDFPRMLSAAEVEAALNPEGA